LKILKFAEFTMEEMLKKEGSESVTNCHQLKFEAGDDKKTI